MKMCSSRDSHHVKSARSGFVVYRVCTQPNRKQITSPEQLTEYAECAIQHTQHTALPFVSDLPQSHLLQLILCVRLGEFSYAAFVQLFAIAMFKISNISMGTMYNTIHRTPSIYSI